MTLRVNGRRFTAPVVDGRASIPLPRLGSSIYLVRAEYGGDEMTTGASSPTKLLWVVF